MTNLFCTMAMGKPYADLARYLVADLGDYDQKILILTDHPATFRRFKNALVIEHRPVSFSYHDKRLALKAALELSETAIFIDADCILRFGVNRDTVRQSFSHAFPPGFHVWKVSTIKGAGIHVFPEKEQLAREWGIEFDRDRITYQEMLFALTKESGKEDQFFRLWDRFAEVATLSNDAGAGEGVCMGIAAQGSGVTCHDSKHMDSSSLSKLFWHCHLDYRLRLYHRLKIRLMRSLGRFPEPDMSVSAL